MSSSDEWILQIQYVQKRDAGRYECQINTQPVRSYFVQLRVVGKFWIEAHFVAKFSQIWL